MCGQVGLIFGVKRRRLADYQDLTEAFTTLLALHERRGPHATGAAWLRHDGEHRIVKGPAPASRFIRETVFQSLTGEVGHGTTWLAGHTRWVTRGAPANNRNNHPLRCGGVIGTHNGTLVNADALAARLGLARQTEVDSEVLVRLVNDACGADGVHLPRLKRHLAHCRGQMSAILASKAQPFQVLLIHGDKPLCLRHHPGRRVMAYASAGLLLEAMFSQSGGWVSVDLPPMHLMCVDVRDLSGAVPMPFHFQAMRRLPALRAAP